MYTDMIKQSVYFEMKLRNFGNTKKKKACNCAFEIAYDLFGINMTNCSLGYLWCHCENIRHKSGVVCASIIFTFSDVSLVTHERSEKPEEVYKQ